MSNWYREIVTLIEGVTEDEVPAGQCSTEVNEAVDLANTNVCIPRIAYYTNDGRRSYEAILFFPTFEANPGKIVCYAHVGQHSEASIDFFWLHTYNPSEKNMAKAGLTQADFDDLIKEWENMGPEHTPVTLYRRDQPAFRNMRWGWTRK